MTHGLDGLGITVSTEFRMGFIMVSSVRHLEHPEISYLNTSSPKTYIIAYQELNFFIFKCGVFHIITAYYLPLVSHIIQGNQVIRHRNFSFQRIAVDCALPGEIEVGTTEVTYHIIVA